MQLILLSDLLALAEATAKQRIRVCALLILVLVSKQAGAWVALLILLLISEQRQTRAGVRGVCVAKEPASSWLVLAKQSATSVRVGTAK